MRRSSDREKEISLKSVVAFFHRNAFLLLAFFLATAAVTAWKFRQSPSFTATAFVMLENSQSNAVQAVAEKLSGANNYGYVDPNQVMEKYLLLIGSRSFAELAAKSLQKSNRAKEFLTLLGENEVSPDDSFALTSVFLSNLDAARQGSDVIRVTISRPDGASAERLANLIAQTLVDAMSERNAGDILVAKKFLLHEISEIEGRLQDIDRQLSARQLAMRERDFRFGAMVSRSPGEVASIDGEIMDLQRDLMETDEQLADLNKQGLSRSTGALDKFGPEATQYKLKEKARILKRRIETNKTVLEQLLDVARRASDASTGSQGLEKQRELEYQLYSELKKEVMSLDVQQISARSKIRILELAIPGSARSERNLVSMVFKRGLVALLAAFLLALFLENYDPVVRSTRDLESLRLVYLGSIPSFGKRKINWLQKFLCRVPWLAARRVHAMHDISIEHDSLQDIVFKNLRVRVNGLLNQGVVKPRVVSVMSSTTGEGKSSISSNMAKYLAASGKRVLLLDADLRMRSLTNSLGFLRDKGLSEHLMNPKAQHEQPLVRKLSDRLDFLPAGQFSVVSAELLAGEAFQDLLAAMRHYYDFVLVDTPPALPYSEVVPIAAASDLVMFTVNSHSTTIRCVEQTIDKLRFGVETPIGLVLNNHDDRALLMYSQYYFDASGASGGGSSAA